MEPFTREDAFVEWEAAPSEPDADAVRAYFHEIRRVPLLTAGEERGICEAIEAAQRELAAALRAWPVTRRQLAEALAGEQEGPEWIDPALTDARGRRLSPRGLEQIAERAAASSRSAEARRVRQRLDRVRALKARLIRANLRLVVSVAKRYGRSTVPLLDRIQEGNLGLLKAVDRFQYRRGFRFSTFATWWIRQAVTRSLADSGRTIRLPVHLIDELNRIEVARRALTRELGRDPTSEEIAHFLHVPLARILEVAQAAQPLVELDTPIGEEGSVGTFVPDKESPSPEAVVVSEDQRQLVARLIESLAGRERQVVAWRFGIAGERAHTLEAIGARIGLSRERVRQIEKRALDRLRRRLVSSLTSRAVA
jgi:RNA polymerase primary sigma factor